MLDTLPNELLQKILHEIKDKKSRINAHKFLTEKCNFNCDCKECKWYLGIIGLPFPSSIFIEWRNIDDNLHRENDLPAVVWNLTKDKEWWYNGKRHRENDKPAITYKCGALFWDNIRRFKRKNEYDIGSWGGGRGREWWYNGLRHRKNDKPAIDINNGGKFWYYNGCVHRKNANLSCIIWPNNFNTWW